MDDTQDKVEQRYKKMLLSRTPQERLRMASRMYDSVRKLVISGILKERRQLDTSKLRAQVFLRMYGNDFAANDRKRIIKKIPNMQMDTESEAAAQLTVGESSANRAPLRKKRRK